MGHFEEIQIDRSEGWKYSNTLDSGSEGYRAKVYVDDNGKISKDSYSKQYNDKNATAEKAGKENKKNSKGTKDKKSNNGNNDKKKEAMWVKVLKAPFRLLWWVIKQLLKLLWFVVKVVLVLVSFGVLDDILSTKEDA